jgi:hypothetical protein
MAGKSVADCVRALEGKSLHTLARKSPFKIVAVTEDLVEVRVSTGKNRLIRLDRIVELTEMGLQPDELRQRAQQEWEDSWNTSYLAAIAHAASGK